ncbi:MAG TPA: hypothetical protein VGP72_26715 [Planctomycetota bacterium]|jgi:hypothetical protein
MRLILGLLITSAAVFAGMDRPIPRPLPDHPGNIFVAGEEVSVPVAGDGAWKTVDYDGKVACEGTIENGRAALGKLSVGYYEVLVGDKPRVTVGVIAPLAVPTPETSPISSDVAMAWFYNETERPKVASICALAGFNWVRDRLAWQEMEKSKGELVKESKYDDSANRQAEARLKLLQVHHNSPAWANKDGKRFPVDLRDAYNFEREMASRWKGKVLAFEPWNEADIDMFGGHTGAEMAALQKASYLGLKAGNPDVIACMNVFAMHNNAILADLDENQAWPYFDTFNLHHYAGTDSYPGIYAAFRRVSAGKPMWVSECNVPVKWSGDEKLKEPSDTDLRVQAERVATIYASSLFEGSAQVFYFILGHYVEQKTQFGVIHKDLTPRPAFLSIAACGRLLAGARALGKFTAEPNVRAFVFRAFPDGKESDVVVAWASSGEAKLPFLAPIKIPPKLAIYDHLGREKSVAGLDLALTRAPLFAVFPKGTFDAANLQKPPQTPPLKTEKPSPIVLQALWPKKDVALSRSAYRISSEKAESIPVFAYNFGTESAKGALKVTAPEGWVAHVPDAVEIAAGERKELALSVDCRAGSSALVETLKISGNFSAAGDSVLSLRLMPTPAKLKEVGAAALLEAIKPERWQPSITQGSQLKLSSDSGGMLVDAKLGGGDRWIYPVFQLRDEERPRDGISALQFTLTALEGKATFRVIFEEENGSGYVVDVSPTPQPDGKGLEVIATIADAHFGTGWSKPDPNGKLDVGEIKAFKIGCNTQADAVRYSFKDVRWIKLK